MVSQSPRPSDPSKIFRWSDVGTLTAPTLDAGQAVVVERFAHGLNQLHRPAGLELGSGIVCARASAGVNDSRFVPISIDGIRRAGDETIEAQICERLRARERYSSGPPTPLRVLELGAGTSYPGSAADVGGPWLARSLKMRFERGIAMAITDGHGSKFGANVELVNDNGQLMVRTIPGGESVAPAIVGADQFGGRFLGEWSQGNAVGRAIRPALDGDFERQVFGIEVLERVDLRKPHRYQEARGFDLIFARHQHPVAPGVGLNPLQILARLSGSGWEILARRVGRCLNPGGIAILNVDDPLNRSTRQYRVSADGNTTVRELNHWVSDR